MKGSSEHTTEDAYPKTFPVNSIQASAPRFILGSVKEGLLGRWGPYVVGWRNLTLVDWYNRPGHQHHSSGAGETCGGHSRQQPNAEPGDEPPDYHAGDTPGEGLDCPSKSENHRASE